MPGLIPILEHEGIYPYGSKELELFEKRISRFLGREYDRLIEAPVSLEKCGVRMNEGEMWESTNELMAEHYDKDIELFSAFLDSHYMAYTMAYFGETAEDVIASRLTLEEAQTAKFDLICTRSGLQGTEKIFNLGCGFGPLETYLAQKYPETQITSITPSSTQSEYLKQATKSSSHPLFNMQLDVIQGDFGAVDFSQDYINSFDIVFAIGAFEHVRNWDLAFRKISTLLKPGGKLFIHLITSQIVIPQFLNAENTLIGKYYPGGKIWPLKEITKQTEVLKLESSWFINGMNYAKTLDCWHRNFWRNINNLHDSSLNAAEIKHWSEHFSLSKACFTPHSGQIYGNGHFVFTK